MKKFRPQIQRTLRRLGRTLLALYLLAIIGGLIADQYVQFRQSDAETQQFFAARQQPIHIGYYNTQQRQMRYIYTEDDASKPVILFIHGAPSSSSYFRDYLSDTNLRKAANLFAVDRPGYGYSGFGEPEPSIAKQAAMIAPILQQLHKQSRPVLLVAASYGTSIAARMAMDYPQLVDGLVLLAPSLAPGEEKTYDVSYVLESPFFSWAQPRMIHSANVEKLSHRQELEAMLPYWKNITVPVTYFQGANDELIYTSNAAFAKQQLTHASELNVHMLPGLGHLIAFKARPIIVPAIVNMLPKAAQYFAQRKQDVVQPQLTAVLPAATSTNRQ